MTKAPLLLAGLAALAATSGLARTKGVPPATPAGKPLDCIPLPIDESRVRDDRTIDFFRAGKVYRSVLPNSCPGLGFDETFTYETSLSRLCSTDIITVLSRAGGGFMRGASCGLGQFQPVTGIKR